MEKWGLVYARQAPRWRPGLSRSLRLIANCVERLIVNWAQSSSVVSQVFAGDIAAGAFSVGAAGGVLPREAASGVDQPDVVKR